MKPKAHLFFPILLVFLLAGSWPLGAGERISPEIRSVIQAPRYQTAHWGILVSDLRSGQAVYELKADKLFHPASTAKLFTMAAGLDAWGADFRFRTPVHVRGAVDPAGHLNGDLILAGSGDFIFGGRATPGGQVAFGDVDHTYLVRKAVATRLPDSDPLAALDSLARQVAAAGIKRIRGEVIVDDRLFAVTIDPYGFVRTPIVVNDNLIDFTIRPGAPGMAALLEWRPRTMAYQVDAQVWTTAAGEAPAVYFDSAGPGRILVRGQVPAGPPLIQAFQVLEPAAFARALFIEALARAGVGVNASALGRNPLERLPPPDQVGQLPRAALFESPPYAETVRLVLKTSHNLGAELTLLSLAAARGQRTLADGLSLERDFLSRLGVDARSISLSDGKGGSSANLVSPRATVHFLRLMSARPDFRVFREALPILGVDGTLAEAVKDASPARGKVYAKTGSIPYDDLLNSRPVLLSKALAGYMVTSRGRELAFALFVNHVRDEVGSVGRDLARICEIVYQSE